MALADIDTIVVVIMENRSFDHMLGYLALPGPGHLPVDGLSNDPAWLAKYANPSAAGPVQPFRLASDVAGEADLPHDPDSVHHALTTPTAGGQPMGGFVQAYETAKPGAAIDHKVTMGHYDAATVATFDFLAHNFLVCDNWHASLPSSTQPNKLMAMAGESLINDTHGFPIPDQPLVYNWLTARGVDWAVFTWGAFLPFFALMKSWLGEILKGQVLGIGHFHRYDNFAKHWRDKSKKPPPVIFVEPEYSEGKFNPNDDHPPTGVKPGQAFLHDVYQVLTSVPERWAKTMLIITYDEHGGFFDHAPPLPVPASAGGRNFDTTGPRVPAFIVSPQVKPGVFHGALDHTAILQLLADKFDPAGVYSPAVQARQAHFPASLKDLLTLPPSPAAPPIPAALAATMAAQLAAPPVKGPDHPLSELALAYRAALEHAQTEYPAEMATPRMQAMLARMK